MPANYRYDIEGLRAIAILAVLIFHINPRLLDGGYVGVDIFFVISGYLITGHLLRDLANNDFSFKEFYLKRIRRLYPALFTMLLVTSAAVYKIFLPGDIQQFGLSLIGSIFYVSNIFFYTKSDYFNSELENSSLLHTWSLSVEEQFYLLFPILLFFCFAKCRKYLLPILVCLALFSFAASEILLRSDRAAAFFLSPLRFWQFMAGALIVLIKQPLTVKRPLLEGLVLFGLLLLGLAVLFFDSTTPFPGIYALLPTLGTTFIIYAGQRQGLFLSGFLSIAPARFFGKISYSLYLWHWPLIAIYRYRFSAEFSWTAQIMLFILSVVLGYLSFRFIERPARHIQLNRALAYKAVAVSLIGTLIGFTFYKYTSSVNAVADVNAIAQYIDYSQKSENRIGTCFLTSGNRSSKDFNRNQCLRLSTTRTNMLLMGDSHAAQYYDAMQRLNPGINILQATSSGCKPVLNAKGEERCTGVMEEMLEDFIPSHDLDIIVIAARWEEKDIPSMLETVKYISPYTKKVIILGPIIEYAVPLPRLLVFSIKENDDGYIVRRSAKYKDIRKTDILMRENIDFQTAFYYSTLDAICPKSECKTLAAPHVPMQFDYGHLTYEGAAFMVNDMKKAGIFNLP